MDMNSNIIHTRRYQIVRNCILKLYT